MILIPIFIEKYLFPCCFGATALPSELVYSHNICIIFR
jgi:hypothetical protein